MISSLYPDGLITLFLSILLSLSLICPSTLSRKLTMSGQFGRFLTSIRLDPSTDGP